ncbi:carbonic anhydrase 6 [Cinclus cinclus]|uniref:carbonic anhydrase 6 n=1 Tax=Cinclus cinclus TaxID=127875 RepID=UPI002E1369F7
MTNNGHSVQIDLPPTMSISRGLPGLYTAVQMHLHWGGLDLESSGSEHTIDGMRYFAELHIVHYNSANYSSFEEAKDKPQGLAVLAFLYTDGHFENTYYSEFISKLARIRFAGQSTTLGSLDIQAMLPENLSHFYRYQGSLTTPPCSESVIWTIFHSPVVLSHTQIQLLENTLLDWHNQTLRNDYRHVQLLQGRVVEASFPAQHAQGKGQGTPRGPCTPGGDTHPGEGCVCQPCHTSRAAAATWHHVRTLRCVWAARHHTEERSCNLKHSFCSNQKICHVWVPAFCKLSCLIAPAQCHPEEFTFRLDQIQMQLQDLKTDLLNGLSHRGTKSSTFPAFYFPVENIESFVEVHPLRAVSLQAFTLCFWSRAQSPVGSQTILSYSTGDSEHELVVTVGTELGLWVGGHFLSFPLQQEAQGWLHHCITWGSQEGTANLWLNGAAGKAKSIQKGYVSQAGGTLVLGKARDALLGTFSNGFAGWMSQVSLWSRVLGAAEVRALALCRAGQPKGDVIAWGQTPMALLGGVLLQPDTSCQ